MKARLASARLVQVSDQRFVRAVAERRVLGRLAAAEPSRAVFLGGERLGKEAGAFVRTIAERLVRGLAAGAPIIGLAGFDRARVRKPLRDASF